MKSIPGLATGIAILAALCFLAVVSDLPAQQQVTIQGIVYAEDWDDEGNVTAVVIVADGVEYLVSRSGKGGELLALEGKTIKATGVISETEDGENMIKVTSYQVIEFESETEGETFTTEEE